MDTNIDILVDMLEKERASFRRLEQGSKNAPKTQTRRMFIPPDPHDPEALRDYAHRVLVFAMRRSEHGSKEEPNHGIEFLLDLAIASQMIANAQSRVAA